MILLIIELGNNGVGDDNLANAFVSEKLIDDSWTVEYGAGVKDENGALFNLKNFICTDMECFMDSHNLLGCRNAFGEFPVGNGRA